MQVSRAAPGPEDRYAQNRGTGSGGAAAGCAEVVVAAPGRPGAVWAALAGLREPVVWILLAIAFFTAISGKPRGRCADAHRGGGAGLGRGPPRAAPSRIGSAPRGPAWPAGPGGRRRLLIVSALLAGGAVYAGVVGSFSRYSWPATAGIIGLGTIVVLIGWHGPLRDRPAGGRLPVAGTLAWVVVLVAGCLWELGALLQQPSLTTDSYSHPTISTLTDPVLATSPGRSVVLLAWLALGWYLVER